jgi:hypothetical protein
MLQLAASVVLGVFLVPTYFVFLGVGLGKVASIEDLNRDLKDAVTYVGEATASDVASGQAAKLAAETANPVADGADEEVLES